MGFDIKLKSIPAEGLVWQPNFVQASQAKISVHFLSIEYYLWVGLSVTGLLNFKQSAKSYAKK